MPFVLNITKSSRIAKREHGLKLQLIPMHAQYVNLKINEVLFYFYSAGQPQDARVPMVLHRMWRIGKWLRTLDNTRRNISYDNLEGGGGRVLPYIYLIGMCRPKGLGFVSFWTENGYRLSLFWSEFGYGYRGNHVNVYVVSIPNE